MVDAKFAKFAILAEQHPLGTNARTERSGRGPVHRPYISSAAKGVLRAGLETRRAQTVQAAFSALQAALKMDGQWCPDHDLNAL